MNLRKIGTLLCLSLGVGILDAEVAVTPNEVNVTVLSGDTASAEVVLRNASAVSSTSWEAAVTEGGGGLAEVLAHLDEGVTSITDLIPNRFNFIEGVSGSSINDGGGDLYDTGNILNTDLANAIPYSDGILVPGHTAVGPAGAYFTRKYPGLFVFAADLDGVSNFSVTGYIGAGFIDSRGGAVLAATAGGRSYKGFFTHDYGFSTPSVNHLVVVEDTPDLSHTFPDSGSVENHLVSGLGNSRRLYYLLIPTLFGSPFLDVQAQAVLEAFLDRLNPGFVALRGATSGSLDADAEATLTFDIDASGLEDVHFARIEITSGEVGTAVPVTLTVTPSPGLRLPAGTALEFGTAYAGLGAVTRRVVVENAGSQLLAVTNLVLSGDGFTLPDGAGFQLAPGSKHEIEVVFAPSAEGAAEATLTFATNDPSDPSATITLTGTALEPPLAVTPPLAITPPTPGGTLFAGEFREDILVLHNRSNRDVDWSLTSTGAPDLEGVLAAVDARFSEITDLVPNRYDFSEGINGASITDGGGNDMFDTGNRLATNLAPFLPYSDGIIVAHPGVGAEGSYFTRKRTGLFVFAADLDPAVTSFSITGGAGDVGATVQGGGLTMTVGFNSYTGYFKRNFGGGSDPSVNHLIILQDAPPTAVHTFPTNPDLDDDTVSGIGGGRRVYYLLFSSKAGGLIPDATMGEIMRAFLGLLSASHLTLPPPTSGRIAAGASWELPMMIDSRRLRGGDYALAFALVWDDGEAQGAVDSSYALEVVGASNLRVALSNNGVEGRTLKFPNVRVGSSWGSSLYLTNVGSLPLALEAPVLSDTAFTLEAPLPPTLAPGATHRAVVRFAPLVEAEFRATLSLESDDPLDGTTVLALFGNSLPAPTFGDLPAALAFSASDGDSANGLLTFRNSGGWNLLWLFYSIDIGQRADSLAEVRQALDAGFAGIVEVIPGRVDFSGGTYGTSIAGANEIRTGADPNPLPYRNDSLGTENYFTRQYPGLFVFAADRDLSLGFHISGVLGGSGGQVEGERLDMSEDGRDYHGFVKRVFGAGVPSVNHLIILPASAAGAQQFPDNPNDDAHLVSVASGLGVQRVYHLVFSGADGSRVTTSDMTTIMRRFLAALTPFRIDLPIRNGAVPGGESTTVEFGIATDGHPPGTYGGTLVIAGNDPALGPVPYSGVRIPITLEIPERDIAVSPGAVTEILFEGDAPVTRTLDITTREVTESDWQARATVPWLSQDITSGTTPSMIQVTIDPALVPFGGPEIGAIEVTSGASTRLVAFSIQVHSFEIDRLLSDPVRPLVYGLRRGGLVPDDAFVFIIDARSGARVGRIPVGSNATAIALHPAEQRLYVASRGTDATRIIDLTVPAVLAPLALGSDVAGISAGRAGRVITEGLNGTSFRLRNTAGGPIVKTVSTGQAFGDGVGGSATGYYFRASHATGMLQRFDLTNEATITSLAAGPFPAIAGSRLVLADGSGRIIWGSRVFDRNLNLLGDLGAEIHAASPAGDLVVTETAVRKLSTGGLEVKALPFPTRVSAVWGSGERLVLFDPATRQLAALPLRTYRATPESLDFGEVAIFATGERSLHVENTGVESMTLRAVDFPDPAFTLATPLPLALPAGAAADLVVRFSPRRIGSHDGSFHVHTGFVDPLAVSASLVATGVEDLSLFPGFEDWRARYFATAQSPGAGLLDDPDDDGGWNIFEFLYALDPLNGGGPGGHLPEIIALEPGVAVLRYRRASGLDPGFFRYQSSTDLAAWSDVPSEQVALRSTLALADNAEEVTVALPRTDTTTYYRIANDF